ncbi:MAG: error-prone DNA polymerase [Gammaproteobacteria bacterium]|nr:error-prone DNA polymerase [Gammaproteobacteria bacterium]
MKEFAELYCRSNFSFLTGASHPEELVREAHALGYAAIAITDECSVAGTVRAHGAARDLDIKLIIGSAFRVATTGGSPVDIVLLAPSRRAYGQLSELITQGRTQAPKGEYALHMDDFKGRADDCLALWAPRDAGIDELLLEGREVRRCCPRLWIGLGLFLDGRDLDRMAKALRLSMRLDLPITAANNVLMHRAERKPLLDTLAAIRLKQPVGELGTQLTPNAERHLRPLATLAGLYPEDMLAEAVQIAGACHFSLDKLRYEYPRELVPPAMTPAAWLRQLTYEGANRRWPGKGGTKGVPDAVRTLIEHELKLIAELGYEYYFLTIEDIVRFARSQGILCQGRGSAANSAVCYCLGITEVDPSRQHVLFERFISKERQEPPDIDVDFEHERREEVIQYIYGKYGRDRAALAATVITYRPRSALRDVGKALGLDAGFVDLLAKSMAWWDRRDQFGQRLAAAGADPDSSTVRRYIALVDQILGFPRHLSQHVGGFVISAGPLAQLVPIENAAMDERTVIQWDKNDLESLGLLKVDVLGLGMLTAIRKALDLANGFHGRQAPEALTMDRIPPEEASTYEMLQKGDSIGVFQVESRAQMAMLPRLRPERFYDLVIEVAIVRPGPIQGDMVHPYLRRRDGKETVTYPNEAVRKVLERTLGVPIFQEQVIELAMVAAGFTAGEADELRRAMAAWQRRGGLEKFERKLIDGMLARGHSESFARRVFEQIKGFGEYGFPESHAASFALLVYNSAWLKRNEPAAFYAGLLNSLPMGFYSPSQLIQDALRHGIEVRPVDVQASGWDFRLEPSAGEREGSPPVGRSPSRSTASAGGDAPQLCCGAGVPSAPRKRDQGFWNNSVKRSVLPLTERRPTS